MLDPGYPLISSAILTKEHLAAIGNVVAESTDCEKFIETLIWALSGMNEEQGKHFTHSLQMSSRLELLATLGKQKIDDENRQIKFTEIISQLRIANIERNTIVHGDWQSPTKNLLRVWIDGPEKHQPAIATKRRLNSDPLEFSAEKIIKTAMQIAKCKTQLIIFSAAVWPHFA